MMDLATSAASLVLYARKNKRLLQYSACTACGMYIVQRVISLLRQRGVTKRKPVLDAENLKTFSSNSESIIDPKVDLKFLVHLVELLKIMIPHVLSKEAGILLLHSGVLVCRTFLSIYVAKLEGFMIKAIVQKNFARFMWQVAKWLIVAVPATFVNSMIRYFESCLGLAFRSRLTLYAYKLYFTNQTYYRVSNLDNRLTNADQSLTEDLASFSNSVAHLYSSLTKPFLDIVLISIALFKEAFERGGDASMSAPIGISVILLTARFLKAVSPKFGALVSEEARLKGYLRYIHSRVITHSEEIAFYDGHKAEHAQLKSAFGALKEQTGLIYRKRILYIMLEQFCMKYVWSATGMVILAIPTLTAKYANKQRTMLLTEQEDGGTSERTRSFMTNSKMLSSAADAVERLLSSYKEIAELAGYTFRVHEMFKVFFDIANGHYVRTATASGEAKTDLLSTKGDIFDSPDGSIQLENVSIVTPNSDTVLDGLTFRIVKGDHLLINGPNGCGKSSLFRILSGLWPIYKGNMFKPQSSTMFYIPQRPYMTIGTLRDQMIYPDSHDDMRAKGISDSDLDHILSIVHLNYILDRDGGWAAVCDWMDVLSGGEKQRMGLARMFYHRPDFALLDECTSAVSMDVEGTIYQAAKDVGITLLTVTHRPSLWKYHTHMLQFDGNGGWRFEQLSNSSLEQQLSLVDEKHRIEEELAKVPQAKNRLQELCALLGTSSVYVEDIMSMPPSDDDTSENNK